MDVFSFLIALSVLIAAGVAVYFIVPSGEGDEYENIYEQEIVQQQRLEVIPTIEAIQVPVKLIIETEQDHSPTLRPVGPKQPECLASCKRCLCLVPLNNFCDRCGATLCPA